jgi:hypothetical protein
MGTGFYLRTAFSAGLDGDGFFTRVEWERLCRLGWMGTAFSTGLNEDGFFWSAQVGGRRRWVVGAGGWSAQLSGNRPFF